MPHREITDFARSVRVSGLARFEQYLTRFVAAHQWGSALGETKTAPIQKLSSCLNKASLKLHMKERDTLVPYRSTFGSGVLGQEINQLLDKVFDDFWHTPVMQFERNWRPTEIKESAEKYEITVELPGFAKEQITVTAQGNNLKVVAKNERGAFSRTLALPGWDTAQTETSLANGILTISVPKTPEAKEKTFEIKTS